MIGLRLWTVCPAGQGGQHQAEQRNAEGQQLHGREALAHEQHPDMAAALTGSITVNTPAREAGTVFSPVIQSHTVHTLAARP